MSRTTPNWLDVLRKSRQISAWVVAIAVGVVIILHVAHSIGVLPLLLSHERTLELLLGSSILCSIILLDGMLSLEEKSESSTSTITGLATTVAELSDRIIANSEATAYQTFDDFHGRFQNLVESATSVVLMGDSSIPAVDLERLLEKGKRLTAYRPISHGTRADMTHLIDLSRKYPGQMRVYHVHGFEWGSWVLGLSADSTGTEVLLNYSSRIEGSLPGIQLRGKSAIDFSKSVQPVLDPGRDSRTAWHPLRLDGGRQILAILKEKDEYERRIDAIVEEGVLYKGFRSICDMMTRTLEASTTSLDVTHLCHDEQSIELVSKYPSFVKWMQANYIARKERRVTIRRVLIVPNDLLESPWLRVLVTDMIRNDIQIYIRSLEELEAHHIQDFSIYDDKHLVHLTTADDGAHWYSYNKEPWARYTENRHKIDDYRKRFEVIISGLEDEGRKSAVGLKTSA